MNELTTLPPETETLARFTVREFMDVATRPPMSDWVGKIELVDGVITHMSPSGYPHFRYQRDLFLKLHAIFGGGKDGWIAGQELTVELPGKNVRMADVCIFQDPGKIDFLVKSDGMLLGIEIADSTLRADLGPKMASYAIADVPHYWVVDINGAQVHVMSDPEEGSYRTRKLVAFGEPLDLPGGYGVIIVTEC
jgi:Uma2 family endonuclease